LSIHFPSSLSAVFCLSSSIVLSSYFDILVNSMTIWSIKSPKILWQGPVKLIVLNLIFIRVNSVPIKLSSNSFHKARYTGTRTSIPFNIISEAAFLEMTFILFANFRRLSLSHFAKDMKFVLLAKFPYSDRFRSYSVYISSSKTSELLNILSAFSPPPFLKRLKLRRKIGSTLSETGWNCS